MNTIINIKELCQYLSISDSEARRLVKAREIPHFMIGNRIKFSLQSVDNWIKEKEELNKKQSIDNILMGLELNMI